MKQETDQAVGPKNTKSAYQVPAVVRALDIIEYLGTPRRSFVYGHILRSRFAEKLHLSDPDHPPAPRICSPSGGKPSIFIGIQAVRDGQPGGGADRYPDRGPADSEGAGGEDRGDLSSGSIGRPGGRLFWPRSRATKLFASTPGRAKGCLFIPRPWARFSWPGCPMTSSRPS